MQICMHIFISPFINAYEHKHKIEQIRKQQKQVTKDLILN
jgi:hypothetical protein